MKKLPNIHPGEILREEFLGPMHISQNALARAIGMPVSRVSAIVKETRSITADTALRLGHFFGMPPQFWLNLQSAYDVEEASMCNDYSKVGRFRQVDYRGE